PLRTLCPGDGTDEQISTSSPKPFRDGSLRAAPSLPDPTDPSQAHSARPSALRALRAVHRTHRLGCGYRSEFRPYLGILTAGKTKDLAHIVERSVRSERRPC